MRPLILSVLLLAAWSTGASAATRSFAPASFDRIEVTGPFTVDVRTGPAPSAHAIGSDKALDRLVVEVRGRTLLVSAKRDDWGNWIGLNGGDLGKVVVHVTTPALHAAALTGSGDLTVDRVRAPRFNLSLTGSGDVAIGALNSGRLDVSVTGSGNARVAGRAQKLRLALQGSGDIDAAKLAAADAEVNVAGSGDAVLNASRTATVSLMGSGDVRIGGKARCTVNKHGSGDVTCGG
ncbi:DUF2807 domain-containing protein [Sphingomonas oleivorans]|uniref:DUF2807 domain-containing protein n=1 Tax=Sphingomonas oleivorans TaxID=1735121 RepID=A0A2T5FX60_9SPHN|nr:head GIN domain-containing protein [Sphingomonas oleivorans]PTQ10720.1 DUF2807 domain-containing protein [Sphingomonas oleivorans]